MTRLQYLVVGVVLTVAWISIALTYGNDNPWMLLITISMSAVAGFCVGRAMTMS